MRKTSPRATVAHALATSGRLGAVACATWVLAACATTAVNPTTASTASTASTATASPASKPEADKAAAATAKPTGAAPAAPAPAAAASGPRAAGAPAAVPPVPGAPRPFAEVIKDAKSRDGFIPVWSKDDKLWLELKPEHFDKPLFLQANHARGAMGGGNATPTVANVMGQMVQFRRVGNNVQLLAKFAANTAKPGSPIAYATAAGTSDSLLAAVPVQTLPHPERQSILVDANALFLNDLPMFTARLDTSYRTGYALDKANSYIHESNTQADALMLDVMAHFSVPRLPVPSATPTPTTAPQPVPVTGVADPRSFFLGLYYTLSKLPEVPMRARRADGRIGHFNFKRWDFSDQLSPYPRHYVIARWRLEKADPSAALSEPRKPITYWLDKNIPLEYRQTVRDGILEWNKAFERIGFKDAIRVEQQPDNATWSTNDTHHASVRWYVDYEDGALAVGPRVYDPRSGEILDADITIGNGWVSLTRRFGAAQAHKPMPGAASVGLGPEALSTNADGVPTFLPASLASTLPGSTGGHTGHGHHSLIDSALCSHQDGALNEASFGLDLLAMRAQASGRPLSAEESERIAKAILRETVTHEVGHTLGLRHNFRASTIYPMSKVNDPAFSRVHGTSGSIMDYNAFNFALESEPQGEVAMSTLGPYDYWAIEYAYKEIAPDQEAAELDHIAKRGSTDPLLAYGTDEELGGGGDGMDPEVNQRDLGGDPLDFAQRRVLLSQELIARLQRRPMQPGENYETLTRNFASGLGQLGSALGMAAKFVGGVVYLRDQAGSGRNPLTPVPAAKQRAALKLINDSLFALDGIPLAPEFTSRLVESALDRGFTPPMDRSLNASLLGMQTAVLDRLLSNPVAERIQSAPHKLAKGTDVLTLAELYRSVHQAVWRGGPTAAELSPARRALQREYVRRVAAALTKPAGGSAAGDARALHRIQAKHLLAQTQQVLAKGHLPLQTRAHLDEVADTLRAALQAQAPRVVG